MGMVTTLHIVTCFFLICVVLLQQGKGADMGATFGGSGGALFGATGADNLLTRFTAGLATIFMITSIVLAANAKASKNIDGNLFNNLPAQTAPTAAPVADTAEKEEATETVVETTPATTDTDTPESVVEVTDTKETVKTITEETVPANTVSEQTNAPTQSAPETASTN